MSSDKSIAPDVALFRAIEAGDSSAIRSLLERHAELRTQAALFGTSTWMSEAAQIGQVESMRALVEAGLSVDEVSEDGEISPLWHAISDEQFEAAVFLVANGANLTLCRPVVCALSCTDKSVRHRFVKLLVENGLDVNYVYDLYGDIEKGFTALDNAESDPDMVAYLRAHGAKTSEELKGGAPLLSSIPKKSTDEVLAYFASTIGPVDPKAQIEIVPTGRQIAIHSIEPLGSRKHVTLFTTGLSEVPLKTPAGKEEYALAELFIELPGAWPHRDLANPQHAWPTKWLRGIAKHACATGKWLGGPLSIISNDEPPKPLAPGLGFVALMLIAEKSFVRSDGKTVQLFRVTPLYGEERELEKERGFPALLRAFDRKRVPFIVDISRANVAK